MRNSFPALKFMYAYPTHPSLPLILGNHGGSILLSPGFCIQHILLIQLNVSTNYSTTTPAGITKQDGGEKEGC